MSKTRNGTLLLACSLMLVLGVAHATNEGAADHWPAYPMPASDAELEAYAAHQKLRPSYVACLRKGGEVEDAVACIRGEYDHQDRRLDQAFRQLSARMAGERRAQLAAEQGRWSRWRDARCGREEIEVAVADCMLEMAADRATQLEERMAGLAQDSDPAR